MPERFMIFSGSRQIGSSELEHGDPYQGIRTGHFVPEPGYAELEPLFQELTIITFDERHAATEPDARWTLRARRAQLQSEADALDLRVQASSGQTVPTRWVQIDDYVAELGDSEREVTLCVDEYSTYKRFFNRS